MCTVNNNLPIYLCVCVENHQVLLPNLDATIAEIHILLTARHDAGLLVVATQQEKFLRPGPHFKEAVALFTTMPRPGALLPG